MPSSIPLETSYNSLQDMKSIPCQSTSFMLHVGPIWGIGKSSRKNTYCTLLVPICSSHKGEYDGILVCTPDKKLGVYNVQRQT